MNFVNEIMQDECVVYFRKYCEEIAEKARAEGLAESKAAGRAEERADMLRKIRTVLSDSGYSSSEIRTFIKRLKSMQ